MAKYFFPRGKDNPAWKGGRVVDPRGYILVRVGKDHPLADVRGYAYEHRLVAQEVAGRFLREGEEVHHRDENKGNNAPLNLVLASNAAEHQLFHRIRDDLRMPGEANPVVECACGCRSQFLKYDDIGRPRVYVSGHNPHPAPTSNIILMALTQGPRKLRDIAPDLSLQAVKVCLSKLRKKNLVRPVSHGVWEKIECPKLKSSGRLGRMNEANGIKDSQ